MQTTHTHYRTHTCGELRMEHVGQTVTLAGFLENVREVGQNFAFAVLRDFYGVTQVVVEHEAMWKAFKGLNKEPTVQITGVVRERDSKNPKLPTGDIEVVPQPGGRRVRPPEVPLSGSPQPGGEEQHHPPLPGGGRPAEGHA